jgi:signal transduction histidine kinase/ActR/RegA family two-component response regulator
VGAVVVGANAYLRDLHLYADLLVVVLLVVAIHQWIPTRLSTSLAPAALASALFLTGLVVEGAPRADIAAAVAALTAVHTMCVVVARDNELLRRQAFLRLRLEQLGAAAMRGQVDELRRVEQELVRARRNAETANAAKTAFIATMSHELRTPLNGILGLSELLVEDPTLDERERRGHLSAMRSSARVLAALVGDVLDLSRIEAGALEVDVSSFSAVSVVQEVVDVVGPTANLRGITVRGVVEDETLAVLGDQERTRQVLLNLAGNALKFTESGEVCLVARADHDGVRFEVRDTGPGIAEHHQAQIFERFYRVHDGPGAPRGVGLGLAICREIVSAMSGTIGVESRLGSGSCFFFCLPAGEAVPDVVAVQVPDQVVSLDILVCDDEPVNLRVVSGMIRMLGHHVRTASDGVEAVAAASRQPPDLILMDVSMPRMDGIEATMALRAEGHVFPIVALTAHAMASDRYACLRAGMNGYLAKPVSMDVLEAELARFAELQGVTASVA